MNRFVVLCLSLIWISLHYAGNSSAKNSNTTLQLIRGISGQALSTLLKLEKKYRKRPRQHSQILIRIAELYYEKAKTEEAKAVERYDKEIAKFHKTRKGKAPTLKKGRFNKYIGKSIETYHKLINRYPRNKLIDKALFNLAFNYKEVGQRRKALGYFHKLLVKTPNSNLVPDALLNIAEYHFDKNQWHQAITYYEKATQFKYAAIYGYALYKLAWSYYNLKNYSQALNKLEAVVHYGRSPENAYSGNKIELVREALKDLVLFFSESGDRKIAKDYFFRIGGREQFAWMLERLAKLYTHNGDHTNAIAIYEELIDIGRYNENNPTWTLAIVDSYATIGKYSEMLKYLDRLIVTYKKDSDWWEFHKENVKIQKSSYELRENALRAYATKYHKRSKKEQRSKYYTIASELYQKYLKYFNEDQNSYSLRFFYAELLSANRDFLPAAEQYKLVRDDIRSKRYLENAAFNVIHSYDEEIKFLNYQIASNLGNGRKLKKAIKKNEEKQITACDKYIEMVPKGKELINIKFKAARLLYKHKDYEASRPRFAHIAEKYPKHKNAVFSVNLMLDSYNIEKDWKNLNKWARKFYANKILVKHDKLAEELYNLIIDSSFKICLEVEKDKEYKKAAKLFDEFSQEFPDHKLARHAIVNSARNYENADILIYAIDMHKKYLKLYPKSSGVKHAIKSIAVDYEKIGYIDESAIYYNKFAIKYPNDKDSEKAFYNTAYFNFLAGKYKGARSDYLKFLKKFPRSVYAAEAIYAIAEIAKISKNNTEEQKYLTMYVAASGTEADKVVEAHVRMGEESARLARYKEANQHYRNAITFYKKTRKKRFVIGNRFVAKAQFNLANSYYAKFTSIKLKLPKRTMIKRMTDKLKTMKKMNKEFAKVFDYGRTQYAIAALHKIGLSYEEFSKALFNAPMPKNMTTDEIQAFKAELEEVAYPIEEKAINSFEANIEKAAELRIGSKWAQLSYEKMNKFKPKAYPLDIKETGYKFTESATIYKVN